MFSYLSFVIEERVCVKLKKQLYIILGASTSLFNPNVFIFHSITHVLKVTKNT